MNCLWRGLSIFLLVFSVVITGCKPASTARIDEEREAYYLDAKNKLFAEDFEAAVIGFERALEVNPKNAAAHLELGFIHYKHMEDFVSAIYHFQKTLKMRPNHPMLDRIEEHLERCKMDFASSVNLGPLNQNTETRMKNLVEAKDGLEVKVKNLEGQLVQMREVLTAQSEALTRSRQGMRSTSPQLVRTDQGRQTASQSTPSITRSQTPSNTPGIQQASISKPKFRKHVIRSKDTFYNLARHYGVDFKSIEASNPDSNSKKLQIGQVINVPYPKATASR